MHHCIGNQIKSIIQIWLLAGKRIHAFVHLQLCIFRLIEERKKIFQSVAIENENASLSIVGCGFGISVPHSLDHRSASRASLLSSLSFGLPRFFQSCSLLFKFLIHTSDLGVKANIFQTKYHFYWILFSCFHHFITTSFVIKDELVKLKPHL